MSTSEEKKALRTKIRAARRAMTAGVNLRRSREVVAKLLATAAYARAHTIFLYASMAGEVQLYELMERALADGKRVALPLITGEHAMEAIELTSTADLVEGKYGIKTLPADNATVIAPEELDLIIVPGLAFDRAGRRLGMGGGFYDTFMARSRAVRLALAFDYQLVGSVPVEERDEMVDSLITETLSLNFTNKG